MLKEFKEFIARASVIDLAIAVIIGVAFGKIVTSLVEGIIMPPIGLLLGKVDFAGLFYVLNHTKGEPASLADAKAKGIPVIAYGAFINDVVTFVIIAFVIFLVVKIVNRIRQKDPSTKDCPYCLSGIPVKATRCSGCCAELKAA
ncbi:MAG TPA: large conductance mechanosensitive channel protein MscL [Pyrinomonadaceae bacterium]|nr:large conductance mechanosensitive channel protein MscL [Pyrinomonadaceae bacterium]